MSDYDALYCVVLRLQDDEDIDDQLIFHGERLGEIINSIYQDCFIVPVASREIETEEDTLKILDSFAFIDDEE